MVDVLAAWPRLLGLHRDEGQLAAPSQRDWTRRMRKVSLQEADEPALHSRTAVAASDSRGGLRPTTSKHVAPAQSELRRTPESFT